MANTPPFCEIPNIMNLESNVLISLALGRLDTPKQATLPILNVFSLMYLPLH